MEIKPNNIYLGDAYKLIKEMPDKSVDLIYTDIPYLIGSGGGGNSELSTRIQKEHYKLGNKGSKRNLEKQLRELKEKMDNATTREEYEKWHCRHSNMLNKLNLDVANIVNGIDYKILDDFVRICKHIYIYIWCSKEQILPLLKYFVDDHGCYFNILCWCKTNCVPATNNSWLPNIEYCLVFKEKGSPRYNDGYDYKSKWFISSTNKEDKDNYDHPTIKPLQLVKNHLLHSTNENDIVFDPFVGSGTTCVAAKELGRQYIGFEINEKYYKVAIDRLNGINKKGQMSLLDTDFEQLDLFGGNDDTR